MTGVRRCGRSSQSEAVVYLEDLTKFYMILYAGRAYNRTGYDATGYFRLAVIEVKKQSKMLPPTASGGNSRERFKR